MPPATAKIVPRSPWRRRALRALGVGVVLFLLAIGAIAFVLRNLDRPWVKARLQAMVHDQVGFDLDYAHAQGSIGSGLELGGIEVATPPRFRTFAPTLLRIGSVRLDWSLPQLLRVSPRVEAVHVRDLELVVVLDRDGHTSLETPASTPSAPTAMSPAAPPSRLLRDLLGSPLPVERVFIEPIRAKLIRVDGPQVIETITLEGLRAQVTASAEDVQLALGTEAQPLALVARREGRAPGQARLHLRLAVTANTQRARLALELRLDAQDLIAAPQVDLVVALEAEARFDEKAHRIVINATRVELADRALTLSAELERADDATSPPLVRTLRGHLDAQRLLALVPKDLADSLPRIAGGAIDVTADRLALATVPKLLEGGRARAKGEITGISLDTPGLEVAAKTLSLDLRAEEELQGEVRVHLHALRQGTGRHRIEAHDGTLSASCRDVRYDAIGASGTAKVELSLDHLSAQLDALAVDATKVTFGAKGALHGKPPYGAHVDLDAARVRLTRGAQALVDDLLKGDIDLGSVFPDLAHPSRSRGDVRVKLGLGANAFELDAKKTVDAVDYTLSITAPSLTPLERVVQGGVGWAKMALALRSTGRLDGISGSPSIKHETAITLDRPSWRGPAHVLGAKVLSATLHSSGNARRHSGDLVLAWTELRRDGDLLGDGTLTTATAFDAAAPSLSLKTTSSGRAAPEITLQVGLGWGRAHHRLTFDVDATLRKLDALAPVLGVVPIVREFQPRGLELSLAVHGGVLGVVDHVAADGTPHLAAFDPSRLTGDAAFEVSTKGLKWHERDRSIDAPSLAWRGTLKTEGDRRTLRAALAIGELHLALGPTRLDFSGLSDSLEANVTSDPRLGQFELEDRVTLHALGQEIAPDYPTRDLVLALHATRDRDGVIHIPDLRIENHAGGTTASLRGGLDLGEDRRSLSLRGSLVQDLGKLWSDRQDLIGRGSLSTELQVDSGDLRLYRARGSVRMKDATVELPRQKMKVESVDGEIPIVADVLFAKGGPRLLRNAEVNTYSELRFVDQHPLISRHSFLTIGRLETPWATVAPLAGNLVVDNNMLSLSQLELGVRGGRVSGRALVALQGLDTKAQLNIRASGVKSSRGEPFDGSLAVGISVKQHSVQGRAEILRIGRRHLLDLLDVVDPPRVDAAINKVRRALALGYPDQVRVSFNRGFASAKITFGGIARLLKIDEIKGIPMGPIIDRVLEPFLEEEEE